MRGEESSGVLWYDRELQSTVALYSSAGLGKENRSLNWMLLGEQEAYGRSTAGGGGREGLAAAGRAMNRTVHKNVLKALWHANWPV